MPTVPRRLREAFRFDISTKLGRTDYQAFLDLCRNKRKTRAALLRTAVRFYLKSESEKEAIKIENPPVDSRRVA